MNELITSTDISIVKKDTEIYTSSREVAKRFRKEHKNVLRDIRNLISNLDDDDFTQKHFEPLESEILLTKDAFLLLTFGFTGKDALAIKVKFIKAFNEIAFMIPKLLEQIKHLEDKLKTEHSQLEFLQHKLDKPKHANTGTILVPVVVDTLYGQELVYQRVPKDDPRFTEVEKKEGEIKRLSLLINGMSKKIDDISREISILKHQQKHTIRSEYNGQRTSI